MSDRTVKIHLHYKCNNNVIINQKNTIYVTKTLQMIKIVEINI